MVAIKQKVGGDDENEVEEGMEEGCDDNGAPRQKRTRGNWEVDRLMLAKAMHRRSVLWNANQDGHWQSYQRDRACTQLATEMELNKDNLKKMWCSLIDMFHRKRWNFDASNVQLYQLLETMQPGPLHHCKHQPEEVEPLSANNRIQQVYDREVICNRSHPDHSVLTKRDKAFDEVTREQGMSMPELKHHWRTGKIVTKIINTIATIISTPVEVERVGSRMQEIKDK
ncbi:hypothetical protein quinque_000246 [Culex quinquefasciatus]